MAYNNSSFLMLVHEFQALENASDLIKAAIPIGAAIQLEKSEYRPGEIARGSVTMSHRDRFQLYGLLAVLNGTVRSNVNIRTRKWIDSVTNLHVFTFLVRSRRQGQDMVLSPSTAANPTVYHFALPLPETNLPGSFHSADGSIVYRVQVVLGCSGTYKVIGEQEFELAPYFNLNLFTSSKLLAKQSWQTKDGIFVKDRLKFKIIEVNLRGGGGGVTMTKEEDVAPSGGSMLDSLLRRGARLAVTLSLPSTSYCIGDELPFSLTVENPNADVITQIEMVLQNRIIYTAMKSKVVIHPITRVVTTPNSCSSNNNGSTGSSGSGSRIEWKDNLQIPSDLTITSSLVTATVNKPIIFQYILSVLVHRGEGKEPFEAETLLCIGTTSDALPKPRKLIVDLDTCRYPLGYTEMSYPEDWEQMYKTGRFGYVSNANVVIGEEVGPPRKGKGATAGAGGLTRTMSVLSISKPGGTGNTAGVLTRSPEFGRRRRRSGSIASIASTSSTISKPPPYSELGSRRSSCFSLPPSYSQVLREEVEESAAATAPSATSAEETQP